jgi:hypothetical protein
VLASVVHNESRFSGGTGDRAETQPFLQERHG